MDTNVSERLSEYISQRHYHDLSDAEVTVAKQCLLDYVGVAMAGRNERLVRILREQALDEGGNQQASLIGQNRRVTTMQAALINGSAGHAHDYDDVHMAMSGHASVPVAPALLALAEPVIGEHQTEAAIDALRRLDEIRSLDGLLAPVRGVQVECPASA